jgi:tRNA-binding EMAP/Myf-like protein
MEERINKLETQALDLKIAMLEAEIRIKAAEELLLKQIEINDGFYKAMTEIAKTFKGM